MRSDFKAYISFFAYVRVRVFTLCYRTSICRNEKTYFLEYWDEVNGRNSVTLCIAAKVHLKIGKMLRLARFFSSRRRCLVHEKRKKGKKEFT